MEVYLKRSQDFGNELAIINKKYNRISLLRLMTLFLVLVTAYYYIQTQSWIYIVLILLLLIFFIVLMRFHSKLVVQKELKEALLSINKAEVSYLVRSEMPFENGMEFNDIAHPYAYDLDIYGAHSLFQNLNRTKTYIGKKTLANQLLNQLPTDEILRNQQAVKELSQKLDWRQDFMALAKITNDRKALYETLINWSSFTSATVSKIAKVLSFLTPILLASTLLSYWITSKPLFLSVFSFLFALNLAILGIFYKRITIEIANANRVDKIINQYSLLIAQIETESFEAKKLQDLQSKLKYNKETASFHLKRLSVLFSRMDSIGNLITTIGFNGTFLFHVHNLRVLMQWKKNHADHLKQWLEVIGTFEMLNSLANFSYNNPQFVFPILNTNYEISFSNLSHPLLNKNIRIGNEVSFQPQAFMILTGSNMSGKSTFLRSLGVNMVLAGIGAPVCADKANVHPLPILVSMRLSDSLSDSESYFYAEIKRLKFIMDQLEAKPAFVLLDEILRGTNSDDKRIGTIEVVKKMIARKAIGAIATHDLEVCLTTNDYPNQLTNKCFEVEIIDNDLHFDYKLRNGICKNKSATFLMKKMEII